MRVCSRYSYSQELFRVNHLFGYKKREFGVWKICYPFVELFQSSSLVPANFVKN